MTLRTFFSFLSFPFPLSPFLFPDLSRKDRSDSASRVDCRSFSVKKPMYLIEQHTISDSVLYVHVDPAHIITGYIYHNILLEGSKGVRVNSFVFTFAKSLRWRDVWSNRSLCTAVPPLSNKHAIQSLITIAYHADMNIIPAWNEQCPQPYKILRLCDALWIIFVDGYMYIVYSGKCT